MDSNSSFSGSRRQGSAHHDQNDSVVTVFNKLKEAEDKVYQAQHRLEIIDMKNSRIENKNMQQAFLSHAREQIRSFAAEQKARQNEKSMKNSFQIQRTHDTNMKRRKERKQKLEDLRQTMFTRNKWIHDRIKQQRKENQVSIHIAKKREIQSKQKQREQMFRSEQKRLAFLKQFMINKQLSAKLQKEEDKQDMKHKILMRQEMLLDLEMKRSSGSLSQNPQSDLEEPSSKKGYRLTVYKNKKSA